MDVAAIQVELQRLLGVSVDVLAPKELPDTEQRAGPQTAEFERLHVDKSEALPFEVKVPNATSRKVMAELESSRGKRFARVDNLMKDLNAGV